VMKGIERRIRQHFKDDDLSPDVVHDLATIVRSVVVEQLAERARRGGRARGAKLTAPRRQEIAKTANADKKARTCPPGKARSAVSGTVASGGTASGSRGASFAPRPRRPTSAKPARSSSRNGVNSKPRKAGSSPC